MTQPEVICYSLGGHSRRFADRLGVPVRYLSLVSSPEPDGPFILITPTYGGKVPAPVLRFLAKPASRRHLCGVVASGNRNFGTDYAIAGTIIAREFGVPHLHSFELSGMDEDIEAVRAHILSPTPRSLAS